MTDKEYYEDIKVVRTAAFTSLFVSAINLATIILVMLFLSIPKSYGDDLTMKYGLGFDLPHQTDPGEAKFVSLGHQHHISRVFTQRIDVGAWFNEQPDYRRKSSAFQSYSLGIRVEPGYFFAETYWGIANITQTDTVLSTNFQFTEELTFGVKDNNGKWIGIGIKHFSNAGIQLPNKGRNFYTINLGFEL